MTKAGPSARLLSLHPPVLGVSRFAFDTTQEGNAHHPGAAAGAAAVRRRIQARAEGSLAVRSGTSARWKVPRV